jgi:DNA-binding LytR/AlgR family response regulator
VTPLRPTRVLIVEDEWLIAEQVADALREMGCEIVGPVGQITLALALVKGEQLNAALIDINVHGDRTFGLATALAEASVPFAFLSGYSKTDLPADWRQRQLLQKPVDGGAVCRCVQSLLAA